MNIPYNEILAGLIIALLTGFSGKIFNAFRIRQLYLVIDRPMNFPNPQRAGYTVNVSIINRGKDKEENIEVAFKNIRSLKLVASDYDGVSIKGHKLTIDRLLANTQVSCSVAIVSDYYYNILPLPAIKSNDTNGRGFRDISDVPLSGSRYVAGGMMVVCVISFFLLFPAIFDGAGRLYAWYKYSDYENKGFTFEKYSDMTPVSGYSFKNNDLPVSLKSFTSDGNTVTYEFLVKNNNMGEMHGEIDFIPRDKDSYYSQMSSIYDSYFKSEYATYRALSIKVRERYFRTDDTAIEFNVPPMQYNKVVIKRKIVKGMSMDDMNLSIALHLQGLDDFDQTRMIFYSNKNNLTKSVLSDTFKNHN